MALNLRSIQNRCCLKLRLLLEYIQIANTNHCNVDIIKDRITSSQNKDVDNLDLPIILHANFYEAISKATTSEAINKLLKKECKESIKEYIVQIQSIDKKTKARFDVMFIRATENILLKLSTTGENDINQYINEKEQKLIYPIKF